MVNADITSFQKVFEDRMEAHSVQGAKSSASKSSPSCLWPQLSLHVTVAPEPVREFKTE